MPKRAATPPPVPRPETSIAVRDVRALRALAHPLRGRLLGILRLHGPATATMLAERVGESSGSTSYHLRQLAAYGFVEDVPGRGNGRERWWRAIHRSTHWEAADFRDDPAGREASEELTVRQLRKQCELLSAYAGQRAGLGAEWSEATSLSDAAMWLTPDQARALGDELATVLLRWIGATPDEPADGAELVSVFVDVFPLREHP